MSYSEWDSGSITDTQAVRALAMELGEVSDELATLKAQEARLRDELSRVVAHMGGKAEVAGFGSLAMTAPSVSTTYDTQRLNDLVLALLADGYSDIAESIAACRRQSARAGSLRITRGK